MLEINGLMERLATLPAGLNTQLLDKADLSVMRCCRKYAMKN